MPTVSVDNPIARYASDFLAFAADLHVPLGANTDRLGDHWAEFQKRDFQAIAPSLEALARGEVAPQRRFWFERTKGGSKDSDVAVMILWLLAFAQRSIRIQVGAYDRNQASEQRLIIRSFIEIDSPLNRLLAGVIEIQQNRVLAHAKTSGRPESVCEILTSDAWGSHGSRPDMVLANELTHVGSEAFMQTLLDNADKLPHSLVVIATNAGEIETWQENWRDIARESSLEPIPRWYFSALHEPAPWVSKADLDESRKRNPSHRFARLWQGVWSSGEGDGLNPDDIAACTTLDGPQQPKPDRIYIGGLDLGVKHDHSALAVLAANYQSRTVELAFVESWRPEDFGGAVDLQVVREAVLRAERTYGLLGCGYDPWQAQLMAQELTDQGVNMHECPFTPNNKNIIAHSLLEAFADPGIGRPRLIALYHDEKLSRDLLRLRIKEGPLGFKLDAVKDSDGHADTAIALSIALPAALNYARNYTPHVEYHDEVLVAI